MVRFRLFSFAWIGLNLLLALSAGIASQAQSDPNAYYVSCYGIVSDLQGGYDIQDPGKLWGQTFTELNVANTTGFAHPTATPGFLTAHSHTHHLEGITPLAGASAEFGDRIYVHGSGILRFRTLWSGEFTHTGTGVTIGTVGISHGFQTLVEFYTPASFLDNRPTAEVNVTNGEFVDFLGNLTVNIYGTRDDDAQYQSTTCIEALTPGVTFESASGHSYAPPPASVSGKIVLQNCANSSQSLVFHFHPLDGSASFTRSIMLNADGTYMLTGLPLNAYTVHIKGDKWLAQNVPVDTGNGNVTDANATLLAGDANNDNAADIGDLLLLIAHYNQVAPASGYLDAADFNVDGANDISDLLVLIANYNQQGDS